MRLLPSLVKIVQGGPLGWAFWRRWVGASAIALPVGSTLGGMVGEAARGVVTETLGFAVVGLVVGMTQGLVLRRHMSHGWWYALATTAGFSLVGLGAGTMGWVFGGEAGWRLVGAHDVAVRFAVGGTVAGVVVGVWLGFVDGVLQWLALRERVSWWFVPASMAGEAVGGATSFTLGLILGTIRGDVARAAVVFVGGGAVGAAVTGAALVLLVAQAHRRRAASVRVAT